MDRSQQAGTPEKQQRLPLRDRKWVLDVLAGHATSAPGLTPQAYLRDLLQRAHWPERWRQEWSGVLTGNAPVDASSLVTWAEPRGANPEQPACTALGSLLAPLLEELGLTERQRLAELLVEHGLCHHQPEAVIVETVQRWAALCHWEAERLLEQAIDPAVVDGAVRAYCEALVTELAALVSSAVDQAGTIARRETSQRTTTTNRFGFAAIIDRPLHDLTRWRGGQAPPELAGDYAGLGPEPPTWVPVPRVLERLLTVQRGVLLGEPGTGKSWTLLRLTAEYARRWLAAVPDQGADDRLIPVFVALNAFTGETAGPDGAIEPQSMDAYVRASAQALGPYLPRLLRAGRVVLLCDALNEMPRTPPGVPDRALVAELRDYLQRLVAQSPPGRFLVACRVRDYRQELDALAPLEQVRLLELALDQIHEIAHRRLGEERGEALWRAIGGSDALLALARAATTAGMQANFWDPAAGHQLWQRLRERQPASQQRLSPAAHHAWEGMHQGARLIPLCRNPYLLRVICDLYALRGRLADNRAELFDMFVSTLIEREAQVAADTGRPWPTTGRLLASLERLAAAMQTQQVTTIDERLARSTIDPEDGSDLLEAAVAASLLVIDGGRVRFTHHRAQEFFAARSLLLALEQHRSPAPLLPGDWWDGQSWHETAVILGELLSVGGEGTNGPNRVAVWLAAHSPELALAVVLRHGGGQDLAAVTATTRTALIAGARGRADEPAARGRAAAYRVLGRLEADDRPGVGVRDGLPELHWCAVAGGRCRVGSPDAGWRPLRPQTVDVAPFWIARYPITTAQFAAFVAAADGYANPAWWTGLQRPDAPRAPAFPIATHPREGVDWYEAVAYGRWLTAQRAALNLPAEIPAHYILRLPTEVEWEVAAAWEAERQVQRRYPYGHRFAAEQANTLETGIGQTSAVGLFPAGAAPCGAEELSGNVWEWTLTSAEATVSPPAGSAETAEVARVIRGGSWRVNPGGARTTARLFDRPTFAASDIGFRIVAARSPID